MAKRTVIAPNEELLVQGQLTVVGNVVQVEQTSIITNIENHTLTINSDGDDANAIISLNRNNTYGTITYNGNDIIFNQNIQVPEGGFFKGNVVASDDQVVVDHVAKSFIGTVTSISNHDTSDLAEDPVATTSSGTMYFTDARARSSVSVTDAGGDGSLTYNSGTGVFTYTGPSASEVRNHFSAVFTGGDGGFSYDSNTGVFTQTGPSAAETRAHFSAGAGLTYDSGTGEFRITNTAVSAGDYGSATAIPTFTTNSKGMLTAAANVNIAIPHTQVTDFQSAVESDVENYLSGGDGIDYASGVIDIDSTVARSATNFVAGDGLTGGGTLASNRTFNVVGGDGITANANDIEVDSTVIRTSGSQTIIGSLDLTGATVTASTQSSTDNSTKLASTAFVQTAINNLIDGAPGTLDTLNEIAAALNDDPSLGTTVTNNANDITTLQNRNLVAGAGLSGGGDLTADRTFDIGAGTHIIVNANDIAVDEGSLNHDNLTGFVADEHVAHSSVTLTAGDGLSGGGDITTSRSFAVDSTVVRTSGNQTVAGDKTFTGTANITGELVSPSTSSTSEGAIYYDTSTNEAYIYVGGSARKITPAVDAGDLEDVGATGINIYAGTRVDGATTYHGIKSIADSTYSTISESANVITVNADISAIKGAFSGSSGVNYDSATGAITADSAEIRGLFGASGSTLSYNSGTGVFTSSADNYNKWRFTTATAGDIDVSSDDLVTFQGSAGITVTHSGSTITITGQSGDITAVTAGAGLTGGATSGTAILNVGAGTGITVNANDIEVDMSAFTTGDLTEGSALYFTDARARSAISAGGDLSYNSTTGVMSFTERTDSEVRGLISASGDISYNNTTGVISFTERTDSEVRGLFSASGDGISYDSSTGVFTVSGDITEVTAGTGLSGGGSSGAVSLALDFSELTDMASGLTGNDEIILNLSSNVPRRKAANEINLSIFNLDNTHRQDIRGLFSASGDISYNSTTGVFAFTNDAGDIEGVTAGSGLTGGGTSGTVSLDVNTGTGLQVISDEVQVTFNNVYTSLGGGNGIDLVTSNASDSTGFTTWTGGINVDLTDTTVFTSTNTASRAVVRDGSGNFAAGTITATATQAQYADLAEKYESDAEYQPGTVVVFGGEKEITVTDQENDHRVAGVISTEPAYLMNNESSGLPVALRGRVPCKVIGPVKKGDVLVTSNRPGFAESSDQPHFVSASCMVGKALQSFDGTEGVIEVVV